MSQVKQFAEDLEYLYAIIAVYLELLFKVTARGK